MNRYLTRYTVSLLSLCMVLSIPVLAAAECTAIFANVAQNNDGAGTLLIKEDAQLMTRDPELFTAHLTSIPSNACNGVACSQGGAAAATGNDAGIPGGSDVTVDGANSPLTLAPGNYGTLLVKENRILVLSPSDYTFSGGVNINDGASITINDPGTVRFSSAKQITVGERGMINTSGGAKRLFIYTDEGIVFGQDSITNAVVYSRLTVDIRMDAQITGSISGQSIVVGEDAIVTFEESAISETDFGAFCTGGASNTVDHYAISHSGLGITCEAEPITIIAHDNTNTATEPGDTVSIDLTTSTGNGDWALGAGAGGVLDNGTADDGAASYIWAAGESSVQLLLGHSQVTSSAHLDIDIADTDSKTDQDGVAEDDNLQFVGTAFRFYVNGAAGFIGSQIAGKESNLAPGSQTLTLKAIKTNTDTGVCEARLTNSQEIAMAYQCQNPSSCQSGSRVTINNDESIPGNPSSSADYIDVTLDFGSTGTATLTFDYSDAGEIKLLANKDITASGNDPAVTLSGASNNFVVRPFGFYIDVDSNPKASAASGTKYKAAGEAFQVTLTAVSWQSADDDADSDGVPDSDADLSDNTLTPNFGSESTAEIATISPSIVAPASGAVGSITGSSFSGFGSGAQTRTDVSWSEVGIMSLSASLSDNDYLGSAENVTGSEPLVGRFYPDHFTLTASTLANRSDLSCLPSSGFTYMDEGFSVALTIEARNASDDLTQNYADSFAKLNTYSELNLGAVDSSADLSSRLIEGSSTSIAWPSAGAANAGVASVSIDWSVNRSTPPDGPYSAFTLGIAPNDDDGVQLASFDLDVDSNTNNEHASIGATDIRFGRLYHSNAYGPETEDLAMVARVEYWDGTSFVVNTDDSCTQLAIITDPIGPSGISVGSGTSDVMPNTTPLTVSQGDLGIEFSAPGAGNRGAVEVNLYDPSGPASTGISSMPWLLFDWDSDGGHEDGPGTRAATFGRYRGHDRIIYWRENFSQ